MQPLASGATETEGYRGFAVVRDNLTRSVYMPARSELWSSADCMGTVIDLRTRRAIKGHAGARGRHVLCTQCGERHPVIRLGSGSERCVTAFNDGPYWFCRNRGCRAAWLARHSRSNR